MLYLYQQLGSLGLPLLICSFAGTVFILERLMFFICLKSISNKEKNIINYFVSQHKINELSQWVVNKNGLIFEGVKILIKNKALQQQQREDVIYSWMRERRQPFYANLKLLVLIAVVSPLLGLLGTVTGMIHAFTKLAAHTGPVHPAILAEGVQQAMLTTAAGLIIAIPCLIAAHGFRIWAGAYMSKVENSLNQVHLSLSGLSYSLEPAAQDSDGLNSLVEKTV